MANKERKGILETAVHYGNYIDLVVLGLGLAVGNYGAALFGLAGFAGGKYVEGRLQERRLKGSFKKERIASFAKNGKIYP